MTEFIYITEMTDPAFHWQEIEKLAQQKQQLIKQWKKSLTQTTKLDDCGNCQYKFSCKFSRFCKDKSAACEHWLCCYSNSYPAKQ